MDRGWVDGWKDEFVWRKPGLHARQARDVGGGAAATIASNSMALLGIRAFAPCCTVTFAASIFDSAGDCRTRWTSCSTALGLCSGAFRTLLYLVNNAGMTTLISPGSPKSSQKQEARAGRWVRVRASGEIPLYDYKYHLLSMIKALCCIRITPSSFCIQGVKERI